VLYGISRKGRLLIGRLERGNELVDTLLDLCSAESIRCGEIRALGALSRVELCAYDQKKQRYGPSRAYTGDIEILSLVGNVSEKSGDLACHLHATVARDTDNGIQVIGGHVVTATVFACEVTINACDDLILRRGMDEKTGLSLWTEKFQLPEPVAPESDGVGRESAAEAQPGPPPEKEPASPEGEEDVTWDDVMAATTEQPEAKKEAPAPKPTKPSPAAREVPPAKPVVPDIPDGTGLGEPQEKAPEEIPEPGPEEPWVEPQFGDIVVHPRFGRCKVQRIEDGEYLHVKLKNGRSVRLNLAVINLKLSSFEQGKQVFEAQMGG
jgi:hypothetical protein